MKADLGELNMGTLLEEIIKVMNNNNIKLPSNISMLARGLTTDLLKTTLKGQTRINLDLSGSKQLVESFNRTINNLNICIITAALLLASSLICTTDMNPKILGIPALGFIGYVAALVLGVFLLIKAKKQK